MPDTNGKKHLQSWTSATYRIEVEGRLAENWSDRLAGMKITTRKRTDQSIVTCLTGRLKNQSELRGVLNDLAELEFPILDVQILDEDNDNGRAQRNLKGTTQSAAENSHIEK